MICDFNCCGILCYIGFILNFSYDVRSLHNQHRRLDKHIQPLMDTGISGSIFTALCLVHALTFKCRFYVLYYKQLLAGRSDRVRFNPRAVQSAGLDYGIRIGIP